MPRATICGTVPAIPHPEEGEDHGDRTPYNDIDARLPPGTSNRVVRDTTNQPVVKRFETQPARPHRPECGL